MQVLTIADVSIQISALSKASTALSRVDTDVEKLTETIIAVQPHIGQMRSFNRGNQEFFHLNDLASLKLVLSLNHLPIDSKVCPSLRKYKANFQMVRNRPK